MSLMVPHESEMSETSYSSHVLRVVGGSWGSSSAAVPETQICYCSERLAPTQEKY
jgi:hypothetical protein